MDQFEELRDEYEKLKEEFQTYQNFAESTIQMINSKNTKLEKKLDAIINILEISEYINSNVSDDNLISIINDMIIGILGVTYSSIYIKEKNKFVIKATNIQRDNYYYFEREFYNVLDYSKPFVVNCKQPDFDEQKLNKKCTRSIIGVPINLREKLLGYIVVEHTLWKFFSQDHIKFISAIANQIGIALENNFLYKKVRESAVKDSYLDIFNRNYFFQTVEKKIKDNPNNKFAIVMIDIDDFKKCNDKYGHQFGDKVLLETIKVIKGNIDEEDIVSRYGGEEFVIYIEKTTDYQTVQKKIDNIRKRISKNMVEFKEIKGKVTASFGVGYYPRNGQGLDEVISVADECLYMAKNLGKNRVISK